MTKKTDRGRGKRMKIRFVVLPVFLLFLFVCFLCFRDPGNLKETARQLFRRMDAYLYPTAASQQAAADTAGEEPAAFEDAPFTVEMLDVGQGLALLIGCEGHYMMYDGGGRMSSSYVVSCLKNRGIEALDYIVASHYDEDHIYGLVGVLHVFGCGEVITADEESDTQVCRTFLDTLSRKGYTPTIGYSGLTRQLGNASLTVLGPVRTETEDENERSVVVRILYGRTAVLLMGDAGFEEENAILDTGADVSANLCVCGHHGSAGSMGSAFLDAVHPEAVLVSCGLHNEYGHPSGQTLERIRRAGADVYRTDLQGEIRAASDGNRFSLMTASLDTSESGVMYLCNQYSRVFHRLYCEQAAQMNEWNRRYTRESRDSLLEQGYTPCGWCRP